MAFTYSVEKTGVEGDLCYAIYTWTATGVTSGTIKTGFGKILFVAAEFKTTQRGAMNDTTTAGSLALSSVTAGDTGRMKIYGMGTF